MYQQYSILLICYKWTWTLCQHGWDENLATVWTDIAFPEDISNIFFMVDKRNDYENDDESPDDQSPVECLSNSNDTDESDIK